MATSQVSLNERTVARISFAESGQHIVRDEKLKGFYLLVGRTTKRYMVKGELRVPGQPPTSVKVSVGDASEISASDARTTAMAYLAEIKKGCHPRPSAVRAVSALGELVGEISSPEEVAPEGPTLLEAWKSYKLALIKKARSARTIEGYENHVLDVFKRWNNRPLKDLADNPALVSDRHNAITAERGPYAANGAMRTLSAIYNHVRPKYRNILPRDNPVEAVDFNKERRRNTAMGLKDLPGWFAELEAIENPIRREFHLLTLLSGSRTTALAAARIEHLDLERRVLHLPKPKGGEDRAFDIPLSRAMVSSLMRVMRFGRWLFPQEAKTWIFPADSTSGHIAETKEDRSKLSKWGNDLRQTYRTLAPLAKVSAVDVKLLMNHAIPGVSEGYITREKILEDHLRAQQQSIADVVFGPIRHQIMKPGPLRTWLGPRGARISIAASARAKLTSSPQRS